MQSQCGAQECHISTTEGTDDGVIPHLNCSLCRSGEEAPHWRHTVCGDWEQPSLIPNHHKWCAHTIFIYFLKKCITFLFQLWMSHPWKYSRPIGLQQTGLVEGWMELDDLWHLTASLFNPNHSMALWLWIISRRNQHENLRCPKEQISYRLITTIQITITIRFTHFQSIWR